MVDGLVEHLGPHVRENEFGDHRKRGRSNSVAEGPARKALPHVIVTARQLSQEQLESSHRQGDLSIDELWDAKGMALLVQPVRQAAGVLEEWCRYSMPDLEKDPTVMEPMSFEGNFAYRTANTTFGLLRGTPEFLIQEHEEAAEFVASLPVLLEGWMEQIRKRAIPSLNENASAAEITELQLKLRKLLTRATTVTAQIRSPELCLTAVHRKYLDQMFDTAGIERLEGELESHVSVLDAHLNTLSTMAAKREQRRLGMQEFFFGAGAVLVGIPSLAGILTLLNNGVSWAGNFDTAEAACLVVLMGALIYFLLKLPGGKEFIQWAKHKIRALRERLSSSFRRSTEGNVSKHRHDAERRTH
jgi:hypothetical protein